MSTCSNRKCSRWSCAKCKRTFDSLWDYFRHYCREF